MYKDMKEIRRNVEKANVRLQEKKFQKFAEFIEVSQKEFTQSMMERIKKEAVEADYREIF